eukprot:TCALIF_02940-PA protein Name:"Protein of unknown function" AED:0.26 eAED:0.26 QI:68/1/0.66/1/1/1/3/0/318
MMIRPFLPSSVQAVKWAAGLPLRLLSSHSSHSAADYSEFDSEKRPTSLKALYLHLGPGQSTDRLVSQLAGDVIYQSDQDDPHGVVAFNKPPGLAKSGPISVEALAQPLADRLGLARLIPIKCPERHTSGVALMATNEKSQQRVLKLLRAAKASTCLTHNYHVLTNHFPRLQGQADLVEQSIVLIGNRNAEKHGTHKEPIISRNMTSLSRKESLKKKRIDPPEKIRVYVQCLAKSGLGPAALVSIQPSKIRSMFLRVYMNDLLAPIIGDHSFSYRSRSIMGVMTKVSHKQSPPYNPIQVGCHKNAHMFAQVIGGVGIDE